ncbi:class I SAM-dependent methyltransferase [Actinomadura adrarensis]|uniref:Class I SAM-dependent methyltransferase n=1 Tax=Actinomadura adrarensis TaxID=1819600 RepID=A0ABW3CR49_9ACTN
MPTSPSRRETVHDRVTYWDRYAKGVVTQEETREEALKNAFGWTQYDGHGPGDELLGDATATLELGFGRGNAVAALAMKGIDATGVDLSPAQVEHARRRWGAVPGCQFERGDVTEFLTRTETLWDAIYSIWGGVWFTDPARLLPVVLDRLAPGGRLVFSHAPPVPGSYGMQGMYGAGFTGHQVWVYRWAYEPDTWADILTAHGFIGVEAWVEAAPEPDHVGTLIARAVRPGR